MAGREFKVTNNRTILVLTLKNNTAAGYQGPVKMELLKGAGLLKKTTIKHHIGEIFIVTEEKITAISLVLPQNSAPNQLCCWNG